VPIEASESLEEDRGGQGMATFRSQGAGVMVIESEGRQSLGAIIP
jgi:hypothetical protein